MSQLRSLSGVLAVSAIVGGLTIGAPPVAGVLWRDLARGRDDVTVVVAKASSTTRVVPCCGCTRVPSVGPRGTSALGSAGHPKASSRCAR